MLRPLLVHNNALFGVCVLLIENTNYVFIIVEAGARVGQTYCLLERQRWHCPKSYGGGDDDGDDIDELLHCVPCKL